jgi:hypothetical protein
LGNQCHIVSLPDRGDNEIGVGVKTCARIITGEINGERLVTRLLE